MDPIAAYIDQVAAGMPPLTDVQVAAVRPLWLAAVARVKAEGEVAA